MCALHGSPGWHLQGQAAGGGGLPGGQGGQAAGVVGHLLWPVGGHVHPLQGGGWGALALLAGLTLQVQAAGCGGLPCGQVGHLLLAVVGHVQAGSALALLAGWHLGDWVLPVLGYISGGYL